MRALPGSANPSASAIICNVEAVPINEHLQPGDKLPNEAHLAKELNIGRSSLREAMKLLASRNIVTIRQGSGTYVASSPGVVDDPLGFTFIPDKKACPGSA
ncbi:FadR/GntR family transcriptional regulator [Lachnospira eligens]|uniref:FadR/GntR family transcriptional regulator n=1 Tax=Lachnospira eligens TaxID=39485 RepID=UPI002FE5DF99